ncbi:MAG: Kae1-like domain-containing protein [Bacillota bacterium]
MSREGVNFVALGIDTSCYTTSVAAVDLKGRLTADKRKLIEVPSGELGLQQTAMVFQHVQNLPGMIENVLEQLNPGDVKAVVVSSRPRPTEGSYMPVFMVGHGFARVLAKALDVPLQLTTHQEGHIKAGIWSSGMPGINDFLAVHLSGGTSELLRIRHQPGAACFEEELLGGTTDLHAGQLVDRVGVCIGLPFPAGKELEKLAQGTQESGIRIPSSVKGYHFSFSGPETHARRLLGQGVPPEEVARAIEHCIATTLEKVLRLAVEQTGIKQALVVGGVSANQYIRQRLRERLEHPAVGAQLFFADPQFSTDNAVGVALLGISQSISE